MSLSRQDELSLGALLGNYKLTPMTLAMKLNPSIIPAKHLNYISVKVATAIAAGNGRVIISLPPRHGKSELITKNTPIWTLENYGQKSVILASYGADLSTDFGRKVRDLIQGNEDLLNVRIRADASRANNWLTNLGGAMFSVGLGGPITGRGADVLLIDDYIKEIKESLSQLHRDYIWDWFVTTAFTRLEPGATVVIVATRWHHDDLIGRILKYKPGKYPWENIVIPGIAEANDILGRKPGEALFPERFSITDLQDRKETLGSFFFNALYQQRPENDAGRLTNRDWLKLTTVWPFDVLSPDWGGWKLARVWDLAATEEGGDFMVGTLFAHHKEKDLSVVLDIVRDQFSPAGVENAVVTTAQKDSPRVEIYIEQEPGSSGKLLVQAYKGIKELQGYTVKGIPVGPQDKVIRAQPFLAAVEVGKVSFLEAPWNKSFLDEYDDFPSGEHDDQVDTCAMGYAALSGKKLLRASWGRSSTNEPTKSIPTGDPEPKGEIILPDGKKYNLSDSEVKKIIKGRGASWGRSSSRSYAN